MSERITAMRPARTRLIRGAGIIAVVAAASMTAGCFGGTASPKSTPGTGITSVPGLPDAALEVMNQPQFSHGRWVIAVEDLDTGETLIDLDGDKLAEPGSFVKTYSAGAAWVKWGRITRLPPQ